MRSFLQALFALILAAAFAAPVIAATPGGATQETLTGVLEAIHVDEFASGREREDYSLRTSHGVIPLQFGDQGPEGIGGATVSVTGTRIGKAFRVESSHSRATFHVTRLPTPGETSTVEAETSSTSAATTVSTTTLASATVATPVAKRIAVILINFNDLATQPFTKAAAQNALTGSATSLKAFFEEESRGRMTVTGSVFGWYRINTVSTGCDWRTWHTLGWNAATAAGVDLTGFTNVMFIWPPTTQCGFAGLAYVPGSYTYLNGTINVQVMTHEMGHNLGLGHANARQCSVNGTRVTLAADASCQTVVYADPFSTMGNNALRHNQGSQLGELGWLDPGEVVVGRPGNTYTITPYFGPDGVKLVRIPRGDGTFFDLDVRTPYGAFDTFSAGSPAVSGVTIRIGVGTASPTNSPKPTELLDTTPSTADLKDAPLLVGRTITDPVSTISFTTMSVSAAGVVVRVREGIAPSAPGSLSATATATPSVGLAWTPATDNVAVGSYRVTRNGALVVTTKATTSAWTDTNASLGAKYTYAVAAVDTSGRIGTARTASVQMPPASTPLPTTTADTTPPTAPTSLHGAVTATSVRIAWNAAQDDTGVTGYRISRNGVVVAIVTGTAWFDGRRTPLTTYAYAVVAFDAAGHASQPARVSLSTVADTIRPTAPARFRVASRSGSYVTFAWNASTDNYRVARYLVFKYGRSTPVASTTGTRIRIWAAYGATYYVRAVDVAGNRSSMSARVRGR